MNIRDILVGRFGFSEKRADRVSKKLAFKAKRITSVIPENDRSISLLDWVKMLQGEYGTLAGLLDGRCLALRDHPDYASVMSAILGNYMVVDGSAKKVNSYSQPDVPGLRKKDQLPENPAKLIAKLVEVFEPTGWYGNALRWALSVTDFDDQHLRVLDKKLVLTNCPIQKIGMSMNGIKSCMTLDKEDSEEEDSFTPTTYGPLEAALCKKLWIAYLTDETKSDEGFDKKYWRALVVNGSHAISVLRNYPFHSDEASRIALELAIKEMWGIDCNYGDDDVCIFSKQDACCEDIPLIASGDRQSLYCDQLCMMAVKPKAYDVRVPSWRRS